MRGAGAEGKRLGRSCRVSTQWVGNHSTELPTFVTNTVKHSMVEAIVTSKASMELDHEVFIRFIIFFNQASLPFEVVLLKVIPLLLLVLCPLFWLCCVAKNAL